MHELSYDQLYLKTSLYYKKILFVREKFCFDLLFVLFPVQKSDKVSSGFQLEMPNDRIDTLTW